MYKKVFESIIDHLVTLQIIAEENCLKGKGLYFCLVDIMKAFDMVSREHLWTYMGKLNIQSEYQ